jgi:hypothetical protein
MNKRATLQESRLCEVQSNDNKQLSVSFRGDEKRGRFIIVFRGFCA